MQESKAHRPILGLGLIPGTSLLASVLYIETVHFP